MEEKTTQKPKGIHKNGVVFFQNKKLVSALLPQLKNIGQIRSFPQGSG